MPADPYVYPGTTVLRNKADLTDHDMWQAFELDASLARMAELEHTPVQGNFDFHHMNAIHRHLFQDVYEWAGQPRIINIEKRYPHCIHEAIQTEGDKLYTKLADDDHLKWLNRGPFVEKFTDYWGDVNAVHAYREGNTRAQQAFFSQLAENAGWPLDFQSIDYDRFIEARYHNLGTGLNYEFMSVLEPAIAQPGRPQAGE